MGNYEVNSKFRLWIVEMKDRFAIAVHRWHKMRWGETSRRQIHRRPSGANHPVFLAKCTVDETYCYRLQVATTNTVKFYNRFTNRPTKSHHIAHLFDFLPATWFTKWAVNVERVIVVFARGRPIHYLITTKNNMAVRVSMKTVLLLPLLLYLFIYFI